MCVTLIEVAFFKANSADIYQIGLYMLHVLNKHTLDMILELTSMLIVMNPARIALSDWEF